MSKKRKTGRNITRAKLATKAPHRRDMLKLMRNGAVGVTVLGGVGYWAVGSYAACAAEHDLSRVGQGAPTVV